VLGRADSWPREIWVNFQALSNIQPLLQAATWRLYIASVQRAFNRNKYLIMRG